MTEIERSSFKLSVLIPVYNEHKTIEACIRRIQAVDLPKELILVDDASDDGSSEIIQSLESPEIKVARHEINRGKGAAVRTAISLADGDICVIQDADLEYDPQELPRLIEPILDGRADAVYGSRFLGGPQRVHLFWHYVGNRLLTLLSNALTNINLSDMETCYKAIRTPLLHTIPLSSNRFGFEPEITAKLARKKARIYEIPISYSGRDYSEGKKIDWRDGLAALYWILRYRLMD